MGTELALEFTDAAKRFLAGASTLSEDQRRTIAELDASLAELPGTDAGRTWADRDALIHDRRWSEVREKAAAVLSAFGWTREVPPPGEAVYIEGLGIWSGR